MKSATLRRCLRPLLVLLSATTAVAQSVPAVAPATPATSPKEEAIVLSPFEVSSEKDTGYAATETLAGTRMRTDLRDIGASMNILTPEFMRDLGVNSFDQALLYTPSVDAVEGDNSDANRASGSQMRFGTGQSFSIRGFSTNAGNQSASHDFFTALDSADNYNVERVTLSLGPNALLIGVGNPQGTAVTSTKRALLTRKKFDVQTQFDTNGSRRAAFDFNQPLIKDRLAIRLNVLHDEAREFRKYEGKNQERLTVSVTAKPWANTKFTLNHENYSLGTNAASLTWGFDGAALRWAAAGKPVINFLPIPSWTATATYVDAAGNRIPVAQGVVDADGFVDARTDFDPTLALGQITANTQTWVVGLNVPNPMMNLRYQTNLGAATFSGQNSAFYQSKDPWASFGLAKDAYLYGGSWDEPSNKQHGRWSQLLFEQKLAENLFLELGANLALHHQTMDTTNFINVSIDPNRYLPDRTLNPGYLQPYAAANAQQRPVKNRAAEYRATLSYELDLTKRHRWFGRHNFSGLWQYTRNEAEQEVLNPRNLGSVGLPTTGGWSGNLMDGTNTLNFRAYFVNGYLPILPDLNQVNNNLSLLNSYGKLVGYSANEQAPIDLRNVTTLNAIKSKFLDDAISLGWQARWFGNRLVTVVGYRQDKTKSYGVPTVRNVVYPEIPGSATDVLKQGFASAKDISYSATPSVVSNGLTRTYGGVYHALSWLSLTYSRSSNFLPVANASWVDALGQPAPNSEGTTVDYGLRLSLLQNKLSVGLSKFETSAANQARNANGSVGGTRNILTRLRNNYKLAGDPYFADLAAAGEYPVDTGNVSDTWSYVATGYELNVVFNPSRNWRISLSGSKNENVLGDHILAIGDYLYTDSKYQGLGTWKKFAAELRKVEAGQRSSIFALDPTIPANVTLAAADALYLEQQIATQEKSYLDDQALTGITTSRSGKYAFNGLITRSFSEGRLKGWSTGVNFRWRSPGTLGYERFPDATGAPTGNLDVTRPIEGKEFWDVGAMVSHTRRIFGNINLRLQLNIQNLPNWQEPQLVKVGYDTNAIYGTTNAIVGTNWQLRRPRNFILTSTFEF